MLMLTFVVAIAIGKTFGSGFVTLYDDNDDDNDDTSSYTYARRRDVFAARRNNYLHLDYQRNEIAVQLDDYCATNDVRTASFCEDVPDYPVRQIERKLNADPQYFGKFFSDPVHIEERHYDDDGSRPMCISYQTIVYPRKGLTVDNTWMYIVNVRDYVQGVLVERCQNPNGDCAEWPARRRPLFMRPVCRQRFGYRRLLAIDAAGRTVMANFQIPCCCVCLLEEDVRWNSYF